MQRIDDAAAPANSSTYAFEDGRRVRVHLKLLSSGDLSLADAVEVETVAYEVDNAGQFVVNADGDPVQLPKQRSRIALTNFRAGAETMQPGWAKVDLSYNPNAPRDDVKDVKSVPVVPDTGMPGMRIWSQADAATYVYSGGAYEQARQQRAAQFAATVAQPAPVPLTDKQLAELRPGPVGNALPGDAAMADAPPPRKAR